MFNPSLASVLTSSSATRHRSEPQRQLSVAAILAGSLNDGSAKRYDRKLVDPVLDELDQAVFNELVADWVIDTRYESSLKIITRHSSFAELVAMGETAVRLILQAMERGDVKVHWFPVLKDITGDDPVRQEDRGFTGRMAQAWITWGKNTGRI